MTCPHASTTTVAWAFGEFEGSAAEGEAHTLHVASCEECNEALEALEVVEVQVAPLAGALAVEEPTKPLVVGVPVRANPSGTALGGRLWAGLVVAAAVLLGMARRAGRRTAGRAAALGAGGGPRCAVSLPGGGSPECPGARPRP